MPQSFERCDMLSRDPLVQVLIAWVLIIAGGHRADGLPYLGLPASQTSLDITRKILGSILMHVYNIKVYFVHI